MKEVMRSVGEIMRWEKRKERRKEEEKGKECI